MEAFAKDINGLIGMYQPASEPPLQIPAPGDIWRHTKRGTKYRILDLPIMQSEILGIDNMKYVVYQSADTADKQLWVRSVREFVLNQQFTHVDK